MTEDLPLGHPAQEPDTATEARVQARVTATVARRRARRRALTTLPVIVVVALVVVAVANTVDDNTGKDRRVVTAGPGAGELAFAPDVEWDSAVLSADGKTLTVTAGRVLHDSRRCQLKVLHDVVQTDDAVTIGLKDATAPEEADAAARVCEEMYTPTVVRVPLDEPLGDRAVFDGVRTKARTVLRLADLVQVTYVPAGFTTNPDDIAAGDSNVQQTYKADGADWYFAVNETKDTAPTDLPGATSTPIMVNDIEGVRITGQMNNTMESIRFPLGERTVTVWGEMQGPPTFTHSDELLKIAQGIRLSETDAKNPASVTTSVPEKATPTTGAPDKTAPDPADCPGPKGSSTDLEGQPDWTSDGYHSWMDRSGCLVRVDVLTDGPGPAHCGYEAADVLWVGDKLGERYRTDEVQELSYVRDPEGVFDLPAVTAAFDPDATLPNAAADTGYHRDGIALHVDPADPSAIWLAYPDGHVERWPLADLPPCA